MDHTLALQSLANKLLHLQQQAEHQDRQGKRNAYLRLAKLDARFSCRSDLFTDYVDELRHDFSHIEQLTLLSQDQELLQVYCDRFIGKFASLQQQLNIQARKSSYSNKKPPNKAIQWQKQVQRVVSQGNGTELKQKLNQQHSFEQQLVEQIDVKKQQLRHSHANADTDKLTQELLTLESRLGECRKTTWKLEQRIAQIGSHF